ncbi:aminotransferase class I/II-fold pyridoxal phosphate-dependent enzyme, partial [Gulbenkiania mobilis]|uniref:aminotransferase class I/II-fold pyridoxal phosphate-dependent enzyme n=1 Tax=Gulbenkiania mobilis TaxID=397457 RepID=UPI000A9D17AA
ASAGFAQHTAQRALADRDGDAGAGAGDDRDQLAQVGVDAAGVLTNPELRAMWEQELTEMRERIHALRQGLVEKLAAAGAPQFGFINEQAGMFSYSGLSREQVERLRDE